MHAVSPSRPTRWTRSPSRDSNAAMSKFTLVSLMVGGLLVAGCEQKDDAEVAAPVATPAPRGPNDPPIGIEVLDVGTESLHVKATNYSDQKLIAVDYDVKLIDAAGQPVTQQYGDHLSQMGGDMVVPANGTAEYDLWLGGVSVPVKTAVVTATRIKKVDGAEAVNYWPAADAPSNPE
jgi:hypothetical protein